MVCNKIEKVTQKFCPSCLYIEYQLTSCWFESYVSVDEFLFKEVAFFLRRYYVLNVKISTFWCHYLSLWFKLFCLKISPGFYILNEAIIWGLKVIFLPHNLPCGTGYWMSFCNLSLILWMPYDLAVASFFNVCNQKPWLIDTSILFSSKPRQPTTIIISRVQEWLSYPRHILGTWYMEDAQ